MRAIDIFDENNGVFQVNDYMVDLSKEVVKDAVAKKVTFSEYK
jgi:hypothetical protein